MAKPDSNSIDLKRQAVSVENGRVQVQLPAESCALVTRAMEAAVETCLFADERDVLEGQLLAALFRACTIAGVTQWELNPRQMVGVNADLAQLGLGAG